MNQKYSGIWPVAPVAFNEDGTLDIEGNKRILECMIDQDSDGICILANYSEQFLLSDTERDTLMRLSIEHIAGRVPIIVTISHFSSDIVVSRAKKAKQIGADIVMMMPPYHGSLLKGTENQIFEQVLRVGDVGIPIMLQDAPLSGIELKVQFLAKLVEEIEMLKLVKIESVGTAEKLRQLIQFTGNTLEGPFDGEEGITLLADLHAGATGSMTSAIIPDQIKPVMTNFQSGNIDEANKAYFRVLPVINHENRQCGFRATKEAMKKGGVIKSAFCRHPIQALPEDSLRQKVS